MTVTATSTPKRRRTQEERSATTRRALLEATIDLLAEEGYANLTTVKVAARAQVSRGAQVHHFRTKAELVGEAIQYLIGQVGHSLLSEVGDLPPGPARTDKALDLLWDTYRGRMFQAIIQLSVAAGGDPTIDAKLATLNDVVAGLIRSTVPVLFPNFATSPGFEDSLYLAVNAMTGLAVSQRVAQLSDAEVEGRWRRTKKQLLRLIKDPN